MPNVAEWAPAILPTLVFAALLFAPGALLLWAAGMRVGTSLLLAPLASAALAGAGGVVLSIANIGWSLGSFAVVSVVAAVVAGLVRFAVQRGAFRLATPRLPRRVLWPILAGLVVNAAVVAVLYLAPVGSAAAISYEYDTIWHFSTIHWMLTTGDASSVNVGLLDGTVGSHFYPAAWHALVALTVQLTGSTIAAAVHGSILAVLLVVWPLGVAALTGRLFGRTPIAIFAVTAVAFLPATFPIGFLDFGVLWSNFFSLALVPLAVVVALMLFDPIRRGNWARLRRDAVAIAVAVLAIPLAMLFAQPNAAFTFLVIVLPLVFLTLYDVLGPRAFPTHHRRARVIGITAFSLVLAGAWILLHDSSFLARTVAVDWPAYETRSQAVGEWLFFGNGTVGQLPLGALVIVGIILAVVAKRARWFAVSYGVLGVLFVFTAGLSGLLRDYLTGFWYHDSPRLAAAGVIVALPFIGVAAEGIVRLLTCPVRPASSARTWRRAVGIVGVLVLVAVTLVDSPLRARATALAEQSQVSEAQWLSPSEHAFLDRVADVTGSDAVIANNPFDGSAMAASLADLRVLFPALPGNWMGTPTPAQTAVIQGLNRAAEDPAVCEAAKALGIEYVLVLEKGERGVFQDGPDQFPGLAVTAETPGFEPVLQDGPLGLSRLTACG